MERELSAGGVVVCARDGRWHVAAIRPRGKRPGVWALPKGHIEPGEPAADAAVREAFEETGLRGEIVEPLGESHYTYRFRGRPVEKVVVFFLLRMTGGTLGALPEGMEREVSEVAWLPLEEAETRLAYAGERTIAARALERLAGDVL